MHAYVAFMFCKCQFVSREIALEASVFCYVHPTLNKNYCIVLYSVILYALAHGKPLLYVHSTLSPE